MAHLSGRALKPSFRSISNMVLAHLSGRSLFLKREVEKLKCFFCLEAPQAKILRFSTTQNTISKGKSVQNVRLRRHNLVSSSQNVEKQNAARLKSFTDLYHDS